MRKSVIGLLLLLFVIGGCSQSPEDKLTSLYNEGLESLEKGDFETAFNNFEEIKNNDSTDSRWLLGQALAFEKRFQFYDAINAYYRLIRLNPNEPEYYLNIADLYHLLGYDNDAVWILQDYRKIDPDNVEILLSEARSYLFLEDVNFAKEALERIGDRYSDENVTKIYDALRLSLLGQIDEAARIISDIDPDSPKAFDALADYYDINYIVDSSLIYSSRAREAADGQDQITVKHLFRLLKNNYLYDSRKIIDQLEARYPDSILALGLDFHYKKSEGINAQIDLAGNKYYAHSGNTLTGKMYQVEAEKAGNNLIALDQEVRLFNGGYYLSKVDTALINFLHYKIFFAYHLTEIKNSDLEVLSNFDQLRMNTREFQLDFAKTKYTTGEFDEGKKLFDQYEKLHLNEPAWLTGLADIYSFIRLDFVNDAIRLYEKSLAINKNYVKAFQGLVELSLTIRKYDQAASYFKKYPQFDNNPSMQLLKARVDLYQGNYQALLNNFENGFKRVNGSPKAPDELIALLKKKFKIPECKKLVDLMVTLVPDNPEVLVLAADFYSNYGEANRGLELANKVLEIAPDNIDAQTEKAVANFYLGNKTEAYEILEKLNSTYVNHALSQYYLARFLAIDRVDDRRAQNIGRNAVFNSFGDPYYLINLSEVYYLTERYDLSFGEARKASRADQFDPYAFYRLGMAASHLRRDDIKEEALKALNKAVELGLPQAVYGDSIKVARSNLK